MKATIKSATAILVSTSLAMLALTGAAQAASGDPGPVTSQGENYVRDGKEVRFWGINMVLQTWLQNLPAGSRADSIDAAVARISDMGFNAIRFWGNREAFYGRAWPDKTPVPQQGPVFLSYTQGDGSYLDLYDRLVAVAKSEDIGIYTTALLYYPPIFADYAHEFRNANGELVYEGVESEYGLFPNEDLNSAERVADRDAWKASVQSIPTTTTGQWFHLVYVDARIQAFYLKHAENFLNHVNQYTGKRNADENNFVIWDMNNEGRFLNDGISTAHLTWPPYFRDEFQRQFNEWLRDKYADKAALAAAWDGAQTGAGSGIALEADEDPALGTVRCGVTKDGTEANRYNRARYRDFMAFAMSLTERWNSRLSSYARGQASDQSQGIAVSPINTDTWSSGLAWYDSLQFTNSISVGSYPPPQQKSGGGPNNMTHPLAPYSPLLSYPLRGTQYLLGSRPAGKPVVIYETNYNDYTPYRAEFPWTVATMASWQNISGVFFYHFNMPRQTELPNPYGVVRYADRGHEVWGHEPMSSALLAAGEAYREFRLPTATDPIHIDYDRRLAEERPWQNFALWKGQYQDVAESEFVINMPGLAAWHSQYLVDYTRRTALARGARVGMVSNTGVDLNVSDVLVSDTTKTSISTDPTSGIIWDWGNSRIKVDNALVNMMTGYLAADQSETQIAWSNGVTLNIQNIGDLVNGIDGLQEPFIAAGLVSLDGLPVGQSTYVRVSAVSHSHWEQMYVSNDKVLPGSGNLIDHRVGYSLTMPALPGRKAVFRDFRLAPIAGYESVDATTGFSVSANDALPVFDVVLIVDENTNGVADGLEADLAVTIDDAPDPVQVGDTVNYTVTVTNNGPHAANDVALTGLPGCALATASLASGELASCTTSVVAGEAGTFAKAVAVSASEPDPDTANNKATATTTVIPVADLAITLSDGPDPVYTEGNLAYTVSVTNSGPSPATGVTATITLPTGVTGQGVPGQGECTGSAPIVCALGVLSNGQIASIAVTAIPAAEPVFDATDTLTADIVASAEVTANETDSAQEDNQDSAITTVVLACQGVAVTKRGTGGADGTSKNRFAGDNGADVIHTLGGNDWIDGKNGYDTVCGGAGDDNLLGGAGDDGLSGGSGTDTCNGGAGSDTVDDTCETVTNVP